jgi:hypothetical protein
MTPDSVGLPHRVIDSHWQFHTVGEHFQIQCGQARFE